MSSTPDPLLSIVVTVVEGGPALRRLLTALAAQTNPPPLQIIVPYDDTIAETGALGGDFPSVTFLAMGHVPTERPASGAAGIHELYDRRRAAGLRASRGELVAILEDRGVPRPEWARTAVRLHSAPWAVIGGAIEPAPAGLLNWAFYVCDFSRYGLPFQGGPAQWVSDVNVTYKRRALDHTGSLWADRYQEPVVHWALQERGEVLYLAPELVVDHLRAPLSLGALLPERFHWGRLFGAIRAGHSSGAKRLALVLLGPVIPLVVLLRHGRAQFQRGHGLRFLWAIPALAVLLVAWTAGEVTGYVTGRP